MSIVIMEILSYFVLVRTVSLLLIKWFRVGSIHLSQFVCVKIRNLSRELKLLLLLKMLKLYIDALLKSNEVRLL